MNSHSKMALLYNHQKQVRDSHSNRSINYETINSLKDLMQNQQALDSIEQDISLRNGNFAKKSEIYSKESNGINYRVSRSPVRNKTPVLTNYVNKLDRNVYSKSPVKNFKSSYISIEEQRYSNVDRGFHNVYTSKEPKQSYESMNQSQDSVFQHQGDLNEQIKNLKNLKKSNYEQNPFQKDSIEDLKQQIVKLKQENFQLKNLQPQILHTFKQERIETRIEEDKQRLQQMEQDLDRARQEIQELREKNRKDKEHYEYLIDLIKKEKQEMTNQKKDLMKDKVKFQQFFEKLTAIQGQKNDVTEIRQLELLLEQNRELRADLKKVQQDPNKIEYNRLQIENFEKKQEIKILIEKLDQQQKKYEEKFENYKIEKKHLIEQFQEKEAHWETEIQKQREMIEKYEGQDDKVNKQQLQDQIEQKQVFIKKIQEDLEEQKKHLLDNDQVRDRLKQISDYYDLIVREKSELILDQETLIGKLQNDNKYYQKTVDQQHQDLKELRQQKNFMLSDIEQLQMENEKLKSKNDYKRVMAVIPYRVICKFSSKRKQRSLSQNVKILKNKKKSIVRDDEEIKKFKSLLKGEQNEKENLIILSSQLKEVIQGKDKDIEELIKTSEDIQQRFKKEREEMTSLQQTYFELYLLSKVLYEFIAQKCKNCRKIHNKKRNENELNPQKDLCKNCKEVPNKLKLEFFLNTFQDCLENNVLKDDSQRDNIQEDLEAFNDLQQQLNLLENEKEQLMKKSIEQSEITVNLQQEIDQMKNIKKQNQILKEQIEQLSRENDDFKQRFLTLRQRVTEKQGLLMNHIQKIKSEKESFLTHMDKSFD